MQDPLTRISGNLADRVSGSMHFRIFLQPLMDAREGNVPFFWALFTDPVHRRDLLRTGWESVGKIFFLVLILDAVYQLWMLHFFYPGEALMVAFFLAIVPYASLRGPAKRLFAATGNRKTMHEPAVAMEGGH